MAVVIMDGRVVVVWCTAVANLLAPTVAELNAGTRLETLITPDGLDIKKPTSKVDVSNLGSVKNAYRAGRIDPDITIKAHHDGATDTAWNIFVYRANGVLVVRSGIDKATAFASTQKVQTWAVESGEAEDVSPAPNSTWDFMVPLYVTEVGFETRAVVA